MAGSIPPIDPGAAGPPAAPGVAEASGPVALDAAPSDRNGDGPPDRSPWVILAAVLFGLFSVAFTITILSNSLPRIADELDSDVSTLTWAVTGPLLAFAVLGPSAGKLADLFGQRRIYLASLIGVVVFAVLTAVAPSAIALVAFRVLGAAAGAATGPASLALINRLFVPAERAKAMGYWAMVAAGAPVIGVVAGGPVVEAFGWRWIFVAQVPLTIVTFVLAARLLPRDRVVARAAGAGTGFDLAGAASLGGAALALLLAVNRGPLWGWTSPAVLAGFVLAPVLVVVFLRVERTAVEPLLPLRYLRRRNFSYPLASQFCIHFAYMGGFVITPLLLQGEFGYGESRTGLLLIARPLVFAVAGPVAGYLTVKVGERSAATGGAVCLIVSMIGLSLVAPGSGDTMVIAALALSGLGMGASTPAMAASIANAVDDRDLGVAGATQQMISQMGAVIGIQMMQTVQAARAGSAGSLGAYGEAYLLGAVVVAIGAVLAYRIRSTPRVVATEDSAGPENDDATRRVPLVAPVPVGR